MNKISTKLALSFIITVLLMETTLMLYLHYNIIHNRTDDELARLMASGSSHRDVLEDNYSGATIRHIALMESDDDREVIITDKNLTVIKSSSENNAELYNYLASLRDKDITRDQIIEDDLKRSPYVVSVHPYNVENRSSGYVVMFQSTEPIKELIGKLNMHFILAGISSLLILCIVYGILSRFLTRPLIHMKEATEKLSMGDYNVRLPTGSNDELGELSRSIQKLASDLDRLKKERNEFLASVSHELSTPLTYLIGYSKVAMRPQLKEEERRHYLTIIGEESNRMKELVINLLDLAKMDEMNFTVIKEYFSAKEFSEDIHQRVSPFFKSKNIQLNLMCSQDFKIFADPIRVEQIVMNLLDNALKYSDESTVVTLELYQEKYKSVIVVADEGMGISLDEQEKIYEKMYRIEKSRSRIHGGIGLGLSIVKDLVEAHGGHIELRSSPGEGSTFTVRI